MKERKLRRISATTQSKDEMITRLRTEYCSLKEQSRLMEVELSTLRPKGAHAQAQALSMRVEATQKLKDAEIAEREAWDIRLEISSKTSFIEATNRKLEECTKTLESLDSNIPREEPETFTINCSICRDRPKSLSLNPCGHTFCTVCPSQFRECPICRMTFSATNRIYL